MDVEDTCIPFDRSVAVSAMDLPTLKTYKLAIRAPLQLFSPSSSSNFPLRLRSATLDNAQAIPTSAIVHTRKLSHSGQILESVRGPIEARRRGGV